MDPACIRHLNHRWLGPSEVHRARANQKPNGGRLSKLTWFGSSGRRCRLKTTRQRHSFSDRCRCGPSVLPEVQRPSFRSSACASTSSRRVVDPGQIVGVGTPPRPPRCESSRLYCARLTTGTGVGVTASVSSSGSMAGSRCTQARPGGRGLNLTRCGNSTFRCPQDVSVHAWPVGLPDRPKLNAL